MCKRSLRPPARSPNTEALPMPVSSPATKRPRPRLKSQLTPPSPAHTGSAHAALSSSPSATASRCPAHRAPLPGQVWVVRAVNVLGPRQPPQSDHEQLGGSGLRASGRIVSLDTPDPPPALTLGGGPTQVGKSARQCPLCNGPPKSRRRGFAPRVNKAKPPQHSTLCRQCDATSHRPLPQTPLSQGLLGLAMLWVNTAHDYATSRPGKLKAHHHSSTTDQNHLPTKGASQQ